MKKLKFLIPFFLLFFSIAKSQSTDEKIGILFKFSGPFIIHRDALENIPYQTENGNKSNKYYDAIKSMKNDNINPQKKIEDFYKSTLKEKQANYIIIEENLTEENFPKFEGNKKSFPLNIKNLKIKYNVETILIVDCVYGMEFESVGIIAGDKRTNIVLNNFLVETNTNSILNKFKVGNIKNIRKKDLINPPNYPNIEESMNRLLIERIFPKLKTELLNL
ncbi:hypothetical protein [Flavobacterium sp.]|uniref:hypothetical protein n=1 Tax=Flavobacterium sp. TaxID=239 RepID=UPI003791E2D4